MKYLYLLLSGLFLPLISLGQSNYKPGYIVNLDGDTTKGYINYHQWDKNPVSVSFKKSLTDNQVNDITNKNYIAFGVNGLEYFDLKTTHISQDQVQLSNIKQGIDSSFLVKPVFLRILAKGKNVTLYDYTDNIKTRYYYKEKTTAEPTELIYRVYYDLVNSSYVRTDYTFRSQLQTLAQKFSADNSPAFGVISSANYFEPDLIKVFRVINGNQGDQFVPAGLFGYRIFVGTGVAINALGFTGGIKYSDKNNTSPVIAVGTDVFLNKNTQKVFFRGQLSYSQNGYAFAYGPDETQYSSSLTNLKQHTIAFSPQVIVNIYNTKSFKFFIDAGASANLTFYNKNYEFKEVTSGVVASDQYGFPQFLHFWFNVPVKTGVVIDNHLELYAGYSFKTIITNNYDAFGGYYTQYHAGLNYLFGIK